VPRGFLNPVDLAEHLPERLDLLRQPLGKRVVYGEEIERLVGPRLELERSRVRQDIDLPEIKLSTRMAHRG
jgi:hypothetical protein